MATWEDGPEYAPVERPEQFQAPDVAPLDQAPSQSLRSDAAPEDRPDLQPPEQPVAALDTLTATDPHEHRDPTEKFQVVQAVMTDSTSAWSAARSTVLTAPVQQHWAPPSGAPVVTGGPAPAAGATPGAAPGDSLGSGRRSILTAPPSQPIQLSGQQTPAGSYPHPGSNQWFGPGPRLLANEPAPITIGRFMNGLGPFLFISLLVGGLIPVIAPVMYVVAFALSSRVVMAGRTIRIVFAAGAGVIGLVAIITIFTGPTFGEWWSGVGATSLIMCWVLLVASAVLILRAMQSGAHDASGPGNRSSAGRRNSWG